MSGKVPVISVMSVCPFDYVSACAREASTVRIFLKCYFRDF